MDTKYLATHNCGDINPASSLQEIEVRLQSQRRPFVYSHKDHRKYADAEAFHEAGFDAYLTALVMLRLSSKLEAEGNYAERVDTPTQVIEQSMASASTQAQSQPSESSTLTWNTANNADVVDSSTTPVAQENPVVAVKKKKKRRGRGRFKKRAGSSSDDPWTSRFSHDTMFDKLSNLSMEDSDKIESDEGANDSPTPNTSPLSSEKHSTPVKDKMAEMPPFNSDFWQIYGNKLRMFGTKEGVFHLA